MPLQPEGRDLDIAPRQASPLTGKGVLLWLVGFFCSIFLANFALAYFALRTLPGGVLENSWDASQDWNHRIAASRAQAERGWSAQASLRVEGEGVLVRFAPVDREGVSIAGLSVEAVLEHPSDRRADLRGALTQAGAEYLGVIARAGAGEWTLQIQASRDGEVVFATRNRVALGRVSAPGLWR